MCVLTGWKKQTFLSFVVHPELAQVFTALWRNLKCQLLRFAENSSWLLKRTSALAQFETMPPQKNRKSGSRVRNARAVAVQRSLVLFHNRHAEVGSG